MKRFLTLTLVLFYVVSIAQQKMLSTSDIILKRGQLSPQGLSQLSWLPGGKQYSYVDVIDSRFTVMVNDADSKSAAKKLVTLNELNEKTAALKLQGAELLEYMPFLTWVTPTEFTYDNGAYKMRYNTKTKKVTAQRIPALPAGAANFDEAPTGTMAFTSGNNLFIAKGEQIIPITNDADVNIVNGQSVHRDEFGIHKGTFWSPNGRYLAYYRMDQTMVTDYPIIEVGEQPARSRQIKYPMAGAKSHQVTLIVYDVETGKQTTIQTGEPKEQYLTNVAWTPDNAAIYIAVLNRDQNHLKMNRYNAGTGLFEETIFEEKDEKYVQPLHPMVFMPGRLDQFIWQSETEGCNALYLYNTKGQVVSKLTPTQQAGGTGGIIVTDFFGVDAKGEFAYYEGVPFGDITRVIYKLKIADATNMPISRTNGVVRATFNDSYTHFISNFSSPETPREIDVYNNSGKLINNLKTSRNPLQDYKACSMKLFTIKAADGKTNLWCRMFLPADFDSTKKYPSLTYVYNGPNAQLITKSWLGGSDLFLYYMAQQGFVVFTVDGRGSENRGKEFEQATFRHLGDEEIADQKKGNEYLRTLSYVDGKRMAVYGWSYGGFMTTSLMTRTPGLYKTGVAGGPVIDWSYYEIMYTERYMDTPEQNPDGYKNSSLFRYADRLEGNLLLIHGTSDDVVVWQHSLAYLKTCVDKGVQLDYFVYPLHLHNVLGKDRAHLMEKVARYIIEHT
jgi:dipeptidyl-peptidase-4